MKISLIIPFFNAAPWIERCLLSCLKQDLPEDEYELILVDDGSTDDGSSVVRKVLGTRSGVTLLSQENRGQGAARNRALEVAKGDFVWFVDADDWIRENCLGSILRQIGDADILAISGADWKDGEAVRRFGWSVSGVVEGRELMRTHRINLGTPFSIYRRSFLEENGLRFLERIRHEDAEFAPRAYYYASKVVCTNDIHYYVFPSPDSTTRSADPQRVYDYVGTVCRSLSDFCSKVPGRWQTGFHNIISSNLNNAMKNCLRFDADTNRSIGEFLYVNRDLFLHLRRSSILKFKLEGLVFAVFPRRAVDIYRLLK